MGKAEERGREEIDDMTEEMNSTTQDAVGDSTPLIFVSHDSRDAQLAGAFSKLLKSVSAGMLKSFRSSDRGGGEGIEFGDEWYKRIMSKLDDASDVVCLFTERSVNRPWILYEAGVAKGKLNTPVHGLALGIPLKRVSIGPFYQFQNLDDSPEQISGLVEQLARRVPGLEPDPDVVATQVGLFKTRVAELLDNSDDETSETPVDDAAMAKLFEEVKVLVRDLPDRVREQMVLSREARPRRLFGRHPDLVREWVHFVARGPGDPAVLLFASSIFREDAPWLYEIGMEAYRGLRGGSPRDARHNISRFLEGLDLLTHHPMGREILGGHKESRVAYRQLQQQVRELLAFIEQADFVPEMDMDSQ